MGSPLESLPELAWATSARRCPATAAAASPALRLLPHAQCHTLLETRLRFGSPLHRRSLEATAVRLLTTARVGSDRPAGRAVRGGP